MGVGYNPRIVTDGLVLCLDAANKKSYPGSGTTWYDLSKKADDLTLLNGPVFSSANAGILDFDGIDDRAYFEVTGLVTTATVEMFAKFESFSNCMPFGWSIYDVYCNDGAMGYNTGNNDQYGLTSTQVTNLGLLNNWKHYVFEMRSDVDYTNNKMYINGVSQSLSQVTGSENPNNRSWNNFNNGWGTICGWRISSGFLMPMNLGAFRIYNRALSVTEVQQNFNATRGRYGI